MQTGRPPKYQRPPLGERIVAFRERLGLSQQQLAEKINVNQQMIAYWERRSASPRPDQILSLAEALNISVDELLGKEIPKVRNGGPVGRVRQVFEAVSQLPRRQQKKIVELLEPFVERHSNGYKKAA